MVSDEVVQVYLKAPEGRVKKPVKQLLGFESPEDAPAAFIRALMESAADTVILPMQDVLGLGGEARMNLPGTTGGNWAWRMLPDAASGLAALRLRQLIEKTGRTGDT